MRLERRKQSSIKIICIVTLLRGPEQSKGSYHETSLINLAYQGMSNKCVNMASISLQFWSENFYIMSGLTFYLDKMFQRNRGTGDRETGNRLDWRLLFKESVPQTFWNSLVLVTLSKNVESFSGRPILVQKWFVKCCIMGAVHI